MLIIYIRTYLFFFSTYHTLSRYNYNKEMYNYCGTRFLFLFYFSFGTGVCMYLLCSPVTCTYLLVNCHQQKGSYVPRYSCKSGPVVLDVGLVGWHIIAQFAWIFYFPFPLKKKKILVNGNAFVTTNMVLPNSQYVIVLM